jgi:hypothetical protein
MICLSLLTPKRKRTNRPNRSFVLKTFVFVSDGDCGFSLSFTSSPHQRNCITMFINLIVLLEGLNLIVQGNPLDKLLLSLKDKGQDSLSALNIRLSQFTWEIKLESVISHLFKSYFFLISSKTLIDFSFHSSDIFSESSPSS